MSDSSRSTSVSSSSRGLLMYFSVTSARQYAQLDTDHSSAVSSGRQWTQPSHTLQAHICKYLSNKCKLLYLSEEHITIYLGLRSSMKIEVYFSASQRRTEPLPCRLFGGALDAEVAEDVTARQLHRVQAGLQTDAAVGFVLLGRLLRPRRCC